MEFKSLTPRVYRRRFTRGAFVHFSQLRQDGGPAGDEPDFSGIAAQFLRMSTAASDTCQRCLVDPLYTYGTAFPHALKHTPKECELGP